MGNRQLPRAQKQSVPHKLCGTRGCTQIRKNLPEQNVPKTVFGGSEKYQDKTVCG